MGNVALVSHGDFIIVSLPPRLDVSNAKPLVEAVRSSIEQRNYFYVFDFSGTETIDSTALGAIIQLYKSVKSHDGDLRLFRVGDGVKRVLAITRIDRVFSLFDSLDEATRLAS
jgi:anti-anti-sigma factor